jgi:hypothetical protein
MTKLAMIPIEGPREVTEGGVNGSLIKFFCKNWSVLSLNPKAKTLQEGDECTNQQHINDPLEDMNTTEKE